MRSLAQLAVFLINLNRSLNVIGAPISCPVPARRFTSLTATQCSWRHMDKGEARDHTQVTLGNPTVVGRPNSRGHHQPFSCDEKRFMIGNVTFPSLSSWVSGLKTRDNIKLWEKEKKKTIIILYYVSQHVVCYLLISKENGLTKAIMYWDCKYFLILIRKNVSAQDVDK